MRTGKLKITVVTTTETRETTYKVIEVNVGERIIVGVSDVNGFAHSIRWFMDIDITDTTQLDKLFNEFGTNSYEWIEPLANVAGAGGGSALDVYPVGIEITTTDTAFNPMKVWGGTWTVTPAGAKRVWKRTA